MENQSIGIYYTTWEEWQDQVTNEARYWNIEISEVMEGEKLISFDVAITRDSEVFYYDLERGWELDKLYEFMTNLETSHYNKVNILLERLQEPYKIFV